MQTGFAGLVLWSFMMASAHGAGVMLLPLLMPICGAVSGTPGVAAAGAGPTATIAAIALCVHSAAMLLTTGVISLAVFDRFGVSGLRTKCLNFDLLWTGALTRMRADATGVVRVRRDLPESGGFFGGSR